MSQYTPEQIEACILAYKAGDLNYCRAGIIDLLTAYAATLRQAARVDEDNQSILDALDFEPDESHTIADMANVGYSLMNAIARNMPDYTYNCSPAEIVVDLINARDEAALSPQPAERQGEAVVENDPHRFAVVSTDYCRPFLLGAYPTLANAIHAQNGEPEKWAIFERYNPAAPVGVPDGMVLIDREALEIIANSLPLKHDTMPYAMEALGFARNEARDALAAAPSAPQGVE